MGFIKRSEFFWTLVWLLCMAFGLLVVITAVSGWRSQASFVQTGIPSQLATATLSSAQVLALNSASGLTLIPGAGPGTIIFVDSWALEISAGGTAYSAGSGLVLHYTGVSGPLASNQIASTTLTSNPNFSSQTAINLAPQPPTLFTNQGLQLLLVGSSFTGGTATVSYSIQYHVLGGF